MDNTANLVSQLHASINEHIVRELEALGVAGIVPSHGDILITLLQKGEITMTELAISIRRDPSTITTLVKKLMGAGYVITEKSKTDKRSKTVKLTEKGVTLREPFNKISKAIYENEYKNISEEEREIFRDILKRMINNFEENKHENKKNI